MHGSVVVEITTMRPDGSQIKADQVLASTVVEIPTVARDGKTCVLEMRMQLPPWMVLLKKSESPYIVER
jgi:hypothetical protein